MYWVLINLIKLKNYDLVLEKWLDKAFKVLVVPVRFTNTGH